MKRANVCVERGVERCQRLQLFSPLLPFYTNLFDSRIYPAGQLLTHKIKMQSGSVASAPRQPSLHVLFDSYARQLSFSSIFSL